MKIYISAGFTARERLRPFRDSLWTLGHEVVSTWLDETAKPSGMEKLDFYRKLSIKDMAEIQSAHLLICDHLEPSTSGGRDIEYGLALGRHQHMQLWIVGAPAPLSPFHTLADRTFTDWQTCVAHLERIQRAENHD